MVSRGRKAGEAWQTVCEGSGRSFRKAWGRLCRATKGRVLCMPERSISAMVEGRGWNALRDDKSRGRRVVNLAARTIESGPES